jgi:hypothetical protein
VISSTVQMPSPMHLKPKVRMIVSVQGPSAARS